ncbi:MAG: nicotinate-nucleotide diphosphorylase (carboxylating) [Ignavibacteria bacterium RBG_13_36_8]|nr:MAG: nicotinate-nucleotide diphosphorylase (carboxylating) [Ignavibacteria bacterium RBG_13_36_8]
METDLKNAAEKIIAIALEEDIKTGDITTDLIIPEKAKTKAYILAKEEGVIAGLPIAEMVFRKLDKNIGWKEEIKDGAHVKPGVVLARIEGSHRAILTGERTALNFLQRISGIATLTARYVDALKGFKTKILDTRKTFPGMRLLDKYAVEKGGGTNHRIGLYDMVLIKDNHIKVAGSITKAVEQIKGKVDSSIKIEVETTTLDEVKEALASGVDIIMLDNMTNEMMSEAVRVIGGRALVEASGSINIDRVKEITQTGVDFISVGALTHSVKALDIGLYIEDR